MNTTEPERNPSGNQPDTPKNPEQPADPEPEQPPATVYLAFTNAGTMAENAALLEEYALRGTFFLTAAEINADPALVRALYAAGHILGVTVPEDCETVAASLLEANDALCRALNFKTLFALLPAWQQEGIVDFAILTRPQEPVSAEGTVRNTAGVLVLEAVIATNLHAVCDRCAAPFERRVSWPVHAVLTRSLEREDEADEWTFLLQEGDMADLDEILTTAFVLNMDSKLLCRPDCKGICPRCGKNLNEGACSCRPEIDPRLAVLGQLLKDK